MLLFYADYAEEGPPSTRQRVGKALRRQAKRVVNRPTVTGFEMWTRLLARSLQATGRSVRVNDYEAARRHPEHPVGLTGYPQILQWWDLRNPAILGPGMLDHPAISPQLMDDERFRYYIVTCAWMHAIFEPYYGDKVIDWFAGIDTNAWPDTRRTTKPVDCLIYDKIRWNRDLLVPSLLDPVKQLLDRGGISYSVLRYGEHSQASYRKLLKRSKFMIFLCEHETQGFAYQEAMASNLPVLAWNPGTWADPFRTRYTSAPVQSSSVPYFSEECGLTFRDWESFPPALDRFLSSLPSYEPRRFVQRELSMVQSARRYLTFYDSIVPGAVLPNS